MAWDTVDTQLDPQLPNPRPDAPDQRTLPDAGEDRDLPALGARGGARQRGSGAAPVLLQRMSLFVLVLFCVYLGVLVMVLPWWARVWDENLWIQSRPALASVLHMGAVRGLISGVGLLDIWIGVSEAVHYREQRG